MLPRGTFDITWSDLLFAARACLRPGVQVRARERVETLWSASGDTLACLSVRSGFDLLLTALALPPGSEILVSAITIRDMTRIIERHGLVPVPVDLDMHTLSVTTAALNQAVSERSRAIVVAHLFGSRMSLDNLLEFARRHDLYVIEDCAQAYSGPEYRGDPDSDARLFSFGPIKTSTALGGGIISVKSAGVLQDMRRLEGERPLQSHADFLKRVVRFAALKFLSSRVPFNIFVRAVRLTGKTHDQVINASVKGFPGPDLMRKIRRQPSYAQLALLERRLQHYDVRRVERRIDAVETAFRCMPAVQRPGCGVACHTHWVVPVQSPEPDELMRQLWSEGFDATRGASSMTIVEPPDDRPELRPVEAERVMRQILYLPIYLEMSTRNRERLARATQAFESRRAGTMLE